METLELLIGLLAAVAVVVRLAGRTAVPEPVLLVLAGLAVALIPGLPEVELEPDLILALFLPPLLYWAALHTDLQELRENLRPIALLAVGLVVVTTAAVAVLGHSVLGLPWAVAVVLGAIVSPPDPVAATAVAGRLGLPRRMVTILEGEGLLNDATALVLFRVAVAAAVSGTFSLGQAGVELVVSAVGAAVGLAVGLAGSRVLRRVSEAPVENTVKLLLPYVAWLAAERLHVSGVLAVLACGLLMARHWSSISSAARLQARQLWDWLVFVLEGLSFVLVGVQLRTVVEGIEGRSVADLALAALALNLVVVVVRLAWVYPASWLPRLSARVRERDPFPGWGAGDGDRLGRYARDGDAGARPGRPHPGRRRRPVPGPEPGGVPGLHGDRGHPCRPGPHPAAGDPVARGGGRRRRGRRRRPAGHGQAVRGRPRPPGRARPGGRRGPGASWSSGSGSVTGPGWPTWTSRPPTASRTGQGPPPSWSTTCSGPSGRSCAGCGSGARSRPRWPGASTTTWTWRRPAWSASARPDSREASLGVVPRPRQHDRLAGSTRRSRPDGR